MKSACPYTFKPIFTVFKISLRKVLERTKSIKAHLCPSFIEYQLTYLGCHSKLSSENICVVYNL